MQKQQRTVQALGSLYRDHEPTTETTNLQPCAQVFRSYRREATDAFLNNMSIKDPIDRTQPRIAVHSTTIYTGTQKSLSVSVFGDTEHTVSYHNARFQCTEVVVQARYQGYTFQNTYGVPGFPLIFTVKQPTLHSFTNRSLPSTTLAKRCRPIFNPDPITTRLLVHWPPSTWRRSALISCKYIVLILMAEG